MISKHSRQYLQFKDDQSLQMGNAVNRDKNKLSMAPALIWKEEVVRGKSPKYHFTGQFARDWARHKRRTLS